MSSSYQLDFNFSSMDWDGYLQYRPRYPKELYELIYDHHTRRGNKCFSKAIDVGAGIGVVARELLTKFDSVIVSDIASHYVESAKGFLSDVPNFSERCSFVCSSAEDLSTVEAESVDLVTIAEAMHWTKPDEAVKAAARILRPGGTLAIIFYGVRPFFVDFIDAQKAYDAVYDKYFDTLFAQYAEKAVPATKTANSRMNNIGFSTDIWEPSVSRLHWSVNRTMSNDKYGRLPDATGANDVVEMLDGSLMIENVDINWIEGYMRNLYTDEERVEALRDELNHLGEVLGSKNTRMAWPMTIVLATKK